MKILRFLRKFIVFMSFLGFFALNADPIKIVNFKDIKNLTLTYKEFKETIPSISVFEQDWDNIIEQVYYSKECWNVDGSVNQNFIQTKIQKDLNILSENVKKFIESITDTELNDLLVVSEKINSNIFSALVTFIRDNKYKKLSLNADANNLLNIKNKLAESIAAYFTLENLIERISYAIKNNDNSYFEFPNNVIVFNYSQKTNNIDIYSFAYIPNGVLEKNVKIIELKDQVNEGLTEDQRKKFKILSLILSISSNFCLVYNEIQARTTFTSKELSGYSNQRDNNFLEINKYLKILELKNMPKTEKDLQKVYYSMAQQYHPDKRGGSEEKMTEINSAYSYLKNMFN